MSSTTQSQSQTGISFLGALFLIFMTLKLTDFIDWSWWYVTAPLWGGVALCLVILALLLVIWCVVKFLEWAFKDRSRNRKIRKDIDRRAKQWSRLVNPERR